MPWLLVVAGVLVYYNSLSAPFIFDDLPSIVDDRDIRSLANLPTVLGDTNRPIVKLSLALNYAIGELDVTGYHVVNISIHILAALTLFGIVRRTLLTKPLRERFGRSAPWLAFAVALLWLLHPLQTQAVTYTIQRSEALMGLFYLLTLYCAIRGAQGKHRYIWGIAAVAACALGMGTKEVMVTVPLVVLLYDRTFLAGSFMAALRHRWGLYTGLAATWGVLFAVVEGVFEEHSLAGFGLQAFGPVAYALTQPGVILHYLRLTVWPHPLCLDYGWPPAKGMTEIVLPAIAIAVLLLATAWAVRRRSWLGFVGAWFFLILAPTSSIMPIADLAVEHRMYLSLASVAVLVVVVTYRVLARAGTTRRSLIGGILLVAVAASLGFETVRRNRDYRSAVSIWQTVVAIAMHHPRAHTNLGVALKSQGQLDEAISHYRQALRVMPDDALAHNNLGVALTAQSKLDEAVHHFRQALRAMPDYAKAHTNLGIALRSQGKLDEAIRHYRKALEIDPDSAKTHTNLGVALRSQGKLDEAIRHYHQALRLKPDFSGAHSNLGNALSAQGKLDEAIRHYRKALEIDPDSAETHNNLGAPLAAQGKLDEAIRHYHQALRLKPDFSGAHSNLGDALSAQGKLDEAIRHYRKALEIDPDSVETHYNLGNALQSQGKLNEAISHYRQALRVRPDDAKVHNNLGVALAAQAKWDEASRHFQRAFQIKPDFAEAHRNLGAALESQGELDEAIRHYRQALRIKPDWPALLTGTAWVLATHPDAKVRDPSQAIELAQRAAELTSYRNAAVLDTLAAAYAAAGRFDDAVRIAQQALELALAHDSRQAPHIRKRLELYKQRKPYRDPVPTLDQPRP